MGAKHGPTIERFMRKVLLIPFSDCWFWDGATNERGYGLIGHGPKCKPHKAHRVSFEIFKGEIPAGLHILHKCDNPSCVNPSHLSLGTHKENMADMASKHRAKTHLGESNKSAKLSAAKVLEIRQSKSTVAVLVDRLGVTRATIRNIQRFKTWRHV